MSPACEEIVMDITFLRIDQLKVTRHTYFNKFSFIDKMIGGSNRCVNSVIWSADNMLGEVLIFPKQPYAQTLNPTPLFVANHSASCPQCVTFHRLELSWQSILVITCLETFTFQAKV